MVEDNEIKTKVSPFAMRDGEIKVFDGKDGYVSMNQILQKINIGHINELHFKILELINEFEFLTSRQIFQLLEHYKFDVKDQEKGLHLKLLNYLMEYNKSILYSNKYLNLIFLNLNDRIHYILLLVF